MERAARLVKTNKYSSKIFTDDDIARAVWPSAVGKAIAAHTSRVWLVRDRLIVEVEDGVWQKQLFPLTGQILVRLHKIMGNPAIRDLEFRVAIPRMQPAKAESRESSLAVGRTSADEAENIQDPVLKKVYQLSRKRATA